MDSTAAAATAALAACSAALGVAACARRGLSGRGRALVYADRGAGERSVASLVESLVERSFVVREIRAPEVIAGGWEAETDLFCIPGGADLPYCELLNGRGNRRIRDYVERGGSFLGLCAGGYYGSSRCEFEVGRRLEVCGERELGFFPGIARGAAFDGFLYDEVRPALSPTPPPPPDPALPFADADNSPYRRRGRGRRC